MANTLNKLRKLSASLKRDAAELRRDGVYRCCVGSYEHAAAHIDAILAQSETERAMDVEATAQAVIEELLHLPWQEAEPVAQEIARRLAAKPQGEDGKAECPWGGCGECVGHEAIQPAGDGVRVTDEDARAVQRLVDRIDLDFVPGTYGDLGAAIEAAEPALRRIAALVAREGGA